MQTELDTFKARLRQLTGLDLNHYKEQQMNRRISQWLARVKEKSLLDYANRLQTDLAERERFLTYLTINTSQFFRDASVFTQLERVVLPEVIARATRPSIWSAGCSIGAEAYSIAMILREAGVRKPVSIIGTDLDAIIIERAKKGLYEANLVSNIPSWARKYFREEEGKFRIDDSIKSMVSFRRHNLLADRFLERCDMILCRNVFIYFTTHTQQELIRKFVASLNPEGYFVVGSAEYIADPTSFSLKRQAYCIYQKVS